LQTLFPYTTLFRSDTFTQEDQARVTKIQAAARGKIARKEVAAKKAATQS
jgi:hypothetical protein